MSHYGKIKSYDTGNGSGMIAPEKGGADLSFGKDDLQKDVAAPEQGQRWQYETKQVDGGKASATNLRQQEQGQNQQSGKREQAEKQQG